MNFDEIVNFFLGQWAVVVGVLVVVSPPIWLAVAKLHEHRLEELRAENRKLAKIQATTQSPSSDRTLVSPPVVKSPLIVFPKTTAESEQDLISRLRAAKTRINLFGLTRNFYVRDDIRPILVAKALEVPVVLYLMDPACKSRRDRYRIEPLEAALEDPARMTAEILARWDVILRGVPSTDAGSTRPGLGLYLFNFPCSFAIEEIDNTYRVMLYGHGKRGTEGPILVFDQHDDSGSFFADQMRWLERMAGPDPQPPWTTTKALRLRKYSASGSA